MNSRRTLVIISCGKRKIWGEKPEAGPTAAKDAYTSPYFKLCRAFAEKFSDQWLILSAKYGVIEPALPIENYDMRFKPGKPAVIQPEILSEQLRSFGVENFKHIVFLGGKAYHEVLQQALAPFGSKLYNPLFGLPIGLRQKRLKAWLKIQPKQKSKSLKPWI